MTPETIQLNGVPVEMFRGGAGVPLLYLHSAGGELAPHPFFDLLARDFQIYAPFHPGFGGSGGLERVDTIEDWVIHYLDLLDSLGIERINIVGVSLGGWLAAELATRNPERLSKLVLVDAAGIYVPGVDDSFEFFQDPMNTPGFAAIMRERCFYDASSEVARSFIQDVIPFDQLLFYYRARQAAARVAWNPYFYNPKLRGRLYRVKCPALVLWGDSDRLLPLVLGQAYHEGIAGSRLKVLEKCGHLPPIEKPAEFAAAVREFLLDA